MKRWVMTQFWRIQQAYAMLSLVLWAILLYFSAPLLISVVVFGALLGFAIAYDRYLKLWNPQMKVVQDRNPFSKETLTVKEILMLKHLSIPTMEVLAHSSHSQFPPIVELRKEILFARRWLESMLADRKLREEVEQLEERLMEEIIPTVLVEPE